ncbi:MAG TPA: FecR family protein [Candidatus Limnocylindria bacterium]|nr:FecR family protein [Candidatus Limnocylindria bacterium]
MAKVGKPAGVVRMRGSNDPRRLQKAVGSVVLAFLLFMAFGVGGVFGGRALAAATTVTIISGDIQVRHGPTGSFVTATDGEVLNAGDAVRTADGSRAVLTYFEGSTVSVEPNTELAIETASSFTDGSTIVVMQQNFGRTWHVVTKLITGNSKYEVKTPASTASVRGTAFQVDSDAERTVVTTTEGTVVDRVADPDRPGQTVDVPVPAGKTHEQKKNARPAPAAAAPQSERTVTVTLDDQNSLVIDSQGRANGIDKNGKRHIETPGAQLVKTPDGKLQIVLPNVSDGRLEALVRKAGGGDVDVQTMVEDRGQEPVVAQSKVKADTSGQARTNVDVTRMADGKSSVKQSTPSPSSRTPSALDAVSGGKKP